MIMALPASMRCSSSEAVETHFPATHSFAPHYQSNSWCVRLGFNNIIKCAFKEVTLRSGGKQLACASHLRVTLRSGGKQLACACGFNDFIRKYYLRTEIKEIFI